MAMFKVICFLMLVSLSTANVNITSSKVTNWGVWGKLERCPEGHYGRAFKLKTEPDQGPNADDTALNAIRIYCGDPNDVETSTITSTEGSFGDWGALFNCYPGILIGFKLRVEKSVGAGDDTATNNAMFLCNTLSNDNPMIKNIDGDGLSWGDWGALRQCEDYQAICAIQTQVEPPLGKEGDDTSMNNVLFECCNWTL